MAVLACSRCAMALNVPDDGPAMCPYCGAEIASACKSERGEATDGGASNTATGESEAHRSHGKQEAGPFDAALPDAPDGRMSLRRALSILGLPSSTSFREARAAYRRLAKQRHPDTGAAKSVEDFVELVQAFEYLKAHVAANQKEPRTDRPAEHPPQAASPRITSPPTALPVLQRLARQCAGAQQRLGPRPGELSIVDYGRSLARSATTYLPRPSRLLFSTVILPIPISAAYLAIHAVPSFPFAWAPVTILTTLLIVTLSGAMALWGGQWMYDKTARRRDRWQDTLALSKIGIDDEEEVTVTEICSPDDVTHDPEPMARVVAKETPARPIEIPYVPNTPGITAPQPTSTIFGTAPDESEQVARMVEEIARLKHAEIAMRQANDAQLATMTQAIAQLKHAESAMRQTHAEQLATMVEEIARLKHAEIAMRQANETQLATMAEELAQLKQAEAASRQAKEETEAVNQAKDKFLAGLQGQLRTPLRPALQTLRMMETDPARSAPQRELLRTIRHQVEKEARLIEDLLDPAKINRFVRRAPLPDGCPSPAGARPADGS